MSGAETDFVLDSPDEATMLIELDTLLAGLGDGVLVTWNGSGFDLPFIRGERSYSTCHSASRFGTTRRFPVAETNSPISVSGFGGGGTNSATSTATWCTGPTSGVSFQFRAA